jgi:hypothetical protein
MMSINHGPIQFQYSYNGVDFVRGNKPVAHKDLKPGLSLSEIDRLAKKYSTPQQTMPGYVPLEVPIPRPVNASKPADLETVLGRIRQALSTWHVPQLHAQYHGNMLGTQYRLVYTDGCAGLLGPRDDSADNPGTEKMRKRIDSAILRLGLSGAFWNAYGRVRVCRPRHNHRVDLLTRTVDDQILIEAGDDEVNARETIADPRAKTWHPAMLPISDRYLWALRGWNTGGMYSASGDYTSPVIVTLDQGWAFMIQPLEIKPDAQSPAETPED